jgi:hypothetical protein
MGRVVSFLICELTKSRELYLFIRFAGIYFYEFCDAFFGFIQFIL